MHVFNTLRHLTVTATTHKGTQYCEYIHPTCIKNKMCCFKIACDLEDALQNWIKHFPKKCSKNTLRTENFEKLCINHFTWCPSFIYLCIMFLFALLASFAYCVNNSAFRDHSPIFTLANIHKTLYTLVCHHKSVAILPYKMWGLSYIKKNKQITFLKEIV